MPSASPACPMASTVVSETMPRVETVSFGAYVSRRDPERDRGRERRLPLPRAHGLQGHREARTPRPSPREMENVGGHLNAYTAREQTAYYCKVLKEDLGAGRRHHRRHPDPFHLHPGGAGARARRHPAGDRPGQRHARTTSSSTISSPPPIPDQPMGRPTLGTEDVIKGMKRAALTDYMQHHYGPERMVVAAAGALEHEALLELVQTPFPRPAAGGAAAARGLPLRRRRVPRGARPRPGAYRARLPLHRLQGPAALPDPAAEHAARRRHVVAAVPGDPGEARAGLFDLFLRPSLQRRRAVRRLCRHRGEGGGGADAGDARGAAQGADHGDPGRAGPRQGAAPRLPADVAGNRPAAAPSSWPGRSRCMAASSRSRRPSAKIAAVTIEEVQEAAVEAFRGTPTLAALGPAGKVPTLAEIAARLAA